jgi:Bacterial regulatory proteins, gntR family
LRRSLHREVVERLRKLILAGELEPRSRVNEAALCERFGIPKCRSKSSAARISQTATLETEFCGQRISTYAPPMSHRDGGMGIADPLLAPQAPEMSCLSGD